MILRNFGAEMIRQGFTSSINQVVGVSMILFLEPLLNAIPRSLYLLAILRVHLHHSLVYEYHMQVEFPAANLK